MQEPLSIMFELGYEAFRRIWVLMLSFSLPGLAWMVPEESTGASKLLEFIEAHLIDYQPILYLLLTN